METAGGATSDSGATPDTGGLGGGLGGAMGGLGSGLGGGLGDITGGGGASGTGTSGGSLGDVTGGPGGGGFLDSIEHAISNFDITGALGSMLGSILGGAALGPFGALGGAYLGSKGADAVLGPHSINSMFEGGPAPAPSSGGLVGMGVNALSGLASGSSGTPGSTPQGGMPTGESSALLPANNAAIALGVPMTTPTLNVASTLGVAA